MVISRLDEEAIFNAARQIGYAADRDSYLRQSCGDDVKLQARVEALLRVHDEEQTFLQSPAAVLPAGVAVTAVSERAGTVIGAYKLLEQIGEGGFALVFMAEQEHPIRRKVAVKVLKPGMDTRQVIARFEAERQALALMDHPNIARVFDGGETASGRPYFVMELVKGVPITDYCDQSHLTPRERLELFVHVCQAVQHAHHKGIIHRDLKPTNVLVTLHDGTPLAKVIDFGIAKATGKQLTDKTLFTNFAQMVGTPLYMSPEQAALSALDVDTRSDIYVLGVLLYELLTGTTPFDKERFRERGFDEICRIIREEEPPKPSTRMSTLGQAATTVSTQRKSDPRRLRQLFRGELDWIVMKCLEKDRNRRYETANALARDVERYLSDEPVQACPPSTAYRFRKFVRRHKAGLTIAGLVLLFIAALGAGGGWLAGDRAVRMAALEGEVNRALSEADDFQSRGRWPEALEAVKRAEGLLPGGGSEELRKRVGERRKDLEMIQCLEDIRLPRAVGGVEGSYDNAGAIAAYSKAFREYGIEVESLEPLEAAERVRARTIRLELALALDHWARICRDTAKGNDTHWKQLVAAARAADPDTWRNELRDAWEHDRREILNKLAASASHKNLPVQSWFLLCVFDNGSLDKGPQIAMLRQAQRRFPDDYWINFKLAYALDFSPPPYHQFDEAVRFYTAALAARPRNVPVRIYLADALRHSGRFDEAAEVYEVVIEMKPESASHLNMLAWHLATCPEPMFRDAARAVELATKAVALAPRVAAYRNTLGVAHYRAGHWTEAIAELKESMNLQKGQFECYDTYFLAMAHWKLGEKDQAGAWYDRAERWMEDKKPRDHDFELQRFRAEAAELLGRQPR
jgi:serine/threonine protein kinase/Tfp pilus assembly protein PilF